MELFGKKVVLRAIEETDCEMLRQMTNDPFLESRIVGWSFPVSKAKQDEWFHQYANGFDHVRYVIDTSEYGAIGLTGLRDIDWKNREATGYGIRIARRDLHGKGFGTDAYMTLLRYAFEELNLNRVNDSALSDNQASLRMMQKVGYKIEGTKRQAVYKGGKYHDVIFLAALKEDYERVVNETGYWKR